MPLFRRNLPRWERLARLIAACALAIAGWTMLAGIWLPALAFATAAMLAATALAGFCPACALFGRRLPGERP